MFSLVPILFLRLPFLHSLKHYTEELVLAGSLLCGIFLSLTAKPQLLYANRVPANGHYGDCSLISLNNAV